MSLYFENSVDFPESGAIFLDVIWHPAYPLSAVASFVQDKGSYVTVFDDHGVLLPDVCFKEQRFQVTTLAWHPEKILLATGWENGSFKIWNENTKELASVGALHKSPITILCFSERGSRLVSCDSVGNVVGWKVDHIGQIVTAFHIDLKEPLTQIAFRINIKSQTTFDLTDLAKAAVAGDEYALDVFSDWRPKTTGRKFRLSHDAVDHLRFFLATQNGIIYTVNSDGNFKECLNTDGETITYIQYHPLRDCLIVVLDGMTIMHYLVDHSGVLVEMGRVKLSGRMHGRSIGNQGMVWVVDNSFAILTGDLVVRIWDIQTNENYILSTTLKLYSSETTSTVNEVFICLAFCKSNQTLCAGTNVGRVYIWNRKLTAENNENAWELLNINSLTGTLKQLAWGVYQLQPLLLANCVTSLYIMKKSEISCCVSRKVWATQQAASQILFQSVRHTVLQQIECQVTNMKTNGHHVLFTNGVIIYVYDIIWNDKKSDQFYLKHHAHFNCINEQIEIFKKRIIAQLSKTVQVFSLDGSPLYTIQFTANEGDPIGMQLNHHYLTVFTIENYIKVYNVNYEQPKLVLSRNVTDYCKNVGEIIEAKSNCNGTKVAITIAQTNLLPDGKLYILDAERNKIRYYNFKPKVKRSDTTLENVLICYDRLPFHVFWDHNDPRFLVCNAKKIGDKSQKLPSISEFRRSLRDEENVIVTMFITPDDEFRLHGVTACHPTARLLWLSAPHIFSLQNLSIVIDVMADFDGLEDCSDETKSSILDFSYYLSLENIDEAFKSIKQVDNNNIWANLAKSCIKNKRLDVAGMCLGHMGNAKAAMALRLALKDQNLQYEAKLAVLAVHLGMLDEAKQLYVQCDRYDLYNKLLQKTNKIDEALKIAETKDRIHLKNTEYFYAKSLEDQRNFSEAAIHYEKANTHRFDIPRMLLDHPQELEAFMSKTTDPGLLKWWGQYIESQGDMDRALKVYSGINDIYNQVRVLCFLGDEERAAELTKQNNDKAASYHMARYYETVKNYEEAVRFFTKANAFGNAVRLCKENHMSSELWSIGAVAGNREKLECARYFEEIGNLEYAIILYHRAGMLHKALDLAFKAKEFDTLQQIASDLDCDSDPALVEKCADYFVTNEQYDKAVDLLAIAKKYKEAISICLTHNVQLSEDLVEKLTPTDKELDEESRLEVLEHLGDSLMMQGNYHLATKKFTQAGDKIRAMKALLKSGDTEKIIFFTQVSRLKEIYIMAANYLQSLDWQNKPEILKNILTFYSKGKAPDLLANFYVACAQVEIDEFQNYEKALGALTEASRCLDKIPHPTENHRAAEEIVQQRLTTIKRFVDIKRLFERGDSASGVTQCRQLLMTGGQNMEDSVRRGDIYSVMIQHYTKSGNFSEARQLINELKQFLSTTSTPITYYINKDVLEALAQGLGVPLSGLVPVRVNREHNSGDGEGDFVEEAIDE